MFENNMHGNMLVYLFLFQAEHKGVSQTVVGLIFGGFKLVAFLSSPLFGNYVSFFFLQ